MWFSMTGLLILRSRDDMCLWVSGKQGNHICYTNVPNNYWLEAIK